MSKSMNILETIVEHKRREVAHRKEAVPVAQLESFSFFTREVLSLKKFIRDKERTGIIAEFKRRSPSKGVINGTADPAEVTAGYARAGASGLSVLTDNEFFGGSNDDLTAAREKNEIPILRKDFTIDEYQVVEARAIGADAILLIAAVLSPDDARRLARLAHGLSMEVLLEVHNEEELAAHADIGADLIGVNNRDLKTFTVSTSVSRRLAGRMPEGIVRVSESGISTPEAIEDLKRYGYEGFLIGENFMKSPDPAAAAADFITQITDLRKL